MANSASKKELNADLYDIRPEDAAFFKQLTGIQDDELLKQHIIQVQTKAYEIHNYYCILHFRFTHLNISTLSGYNQAFSLLKDRDRAILLDLGCCFGTDIRKAVFDGWPIQDAIASDIQKGFWEFGHQLFKTTPNTFPLAFIPANVFDPTFISPKGPFLSMADVEKTATPPLNTLSSLNPVQGKISAIHMSCFFHLFPEDRQLQLAKLVASLLSPEKASVIFGQHMGLPVKGDYVSPHHDEPTMFCHSPDSWTKMWIEDVFGEGRVKVDTDLIRVWASADHSENDEMAGYYLKWSVTRL